MTVSRTGNRGTAPAFDMSVFQNLVRDVGSITVAYDFASMFLALLPARIQRIDQALRGRDQEEILSALLSLQASAAMLGAKQLELSMGRVLTSMSVDITPPGDLKRTLDNEAAVFKQAFAQAHSL